MVVYFNNNGKYNESHENIPIIVNDKPIGFIFKVNEEHVTCFIWDRYVKADEYLTSMNPIKNEIRSISINC